MKVTIASLLLGTFVLLSSCKEKDDIDEPMDTYPGISMYLNIDANDLPSYQTSLPDFYDQVPHNTPFNQPITDAGATLGRVLFFDKALSINNTVSCASCHKQEIGFTDEAVFSEGFDGGLTGAHSMRLANAVFYTGSGFFWDKRAASLEDQTTMPIQDAVEMGFDSAHGGMTALIQKMEGLPYYPELFELSFGDGSISEERMQIAMAQYIRSMVSVNSRFDVGFDAAFNPQAPGPGAGIGRDFTNFTASENRGKNLFVQPPQAGGAGCAGCHQPPSFSLAANSRSNGLDAGETVIFKSPSLKNVAQSGPYMHDGSLPTLEDVVEHYNSGIEDGPALDNRLRPNGTPLRLDLTETEKADLVAFLHTLTDNSTATDPKFSDPFKP